MSHTDALEQAHHLIEMVAPEQMPHLVEVIKSMLDPVSRAIANMPYDDEPESDEERCAVSASRKQHLEHPELSSPFEDVLNEFGLMTSSDGRLIEVATGREYIPRP